MRVILNFTAILIVCCMTFPAHAVSQKTRTNNTAQKPAELSFPARRLLDTVKKAMDREDWAAAIEAVSTAGARSGGKTDTAPCSQPLVCLALGNCHLMRQDLNAAEAAYLSAIRLDPAYLDARVNLAKVYTDGNRYADAAGAFLAAYELSGPRHPDYLYYAGVMTLMDNRASEAAQIFERLLAAHPDRVTRQWKENYANALMTAELWKKAIPLVRELADASQGEHRIKWQDTLLRIYLTLDDTDKAQRYATCLSREAPARARWWKALVHIALSRGQYEKALEDLIIYGFITPLNREEKTLLADLSLQLKIPARAAGMYEAILSDAEPRPAEEKKELILRLANALRQMGRTNRALALLDEAGPELFSPELMLLKGDLLYEAKKFKAADTAYRLAARGKFPQTGQAWLMAGYAAWQSNDLPASKSAFQRAARYKHHRKDALAAMAQLERSAQM